MIIRTITPPPGSAISVATDGIVPVITIPQPRAVTRYFASVFILFWLGMWCVGFASAFSKVLSGNAPFFLIFWLSAWTLGGGFAVYALYRMLRPPVPETLQLGADAITYDSGIPPFRQDFFTANRYAWKSYFPKRTKVTISRQDLRSLRLREADSENRLTVDVSSTRLDLGRAASEVEREWLYRVLSERYSLPAP